MADSCLDTWAEIWATHASRRLKLPPDFSSWSQLPEVSVEDLCVVLRKFKINSALGHVSLHPKAMDVASGHGLQTLLLRLQACERLCCWPYKRVQARLVRLSKASGGHRL
eukprot:4156491-Pyramimonas_sp.AAC.1